ncbi:MAG TPA: hypothetical protein DCQ98_20455 [Planctomycetaceae bacterium]|nr:hypothetical protein [Planctomycetaceae bacterium]HRE98961.1 hypothetical protein [Pirellulaceae bacterium]
MLFRAVVALLGFGGGILTNDTVAAQCGNYVLFVDDEGRPLPMGHHLAEHPADELSKRHPLSADADGSDPTLPCHGIHCRQGKQPTILPPAPPQEQRRELSTPSIGTAHPIEEPSVGEFRRLAEPPLVRQLVISRPWRPPESL